MKPDQFQNNKQNLPNQNWEEATNRSANFQDGFSGVREKAEIWRNKFFWPLIGVSVLIIFFSARVFLNSIEEGVAYNVPDWLQSQLDPAIDYDGVTVEELKASDRDQDGLNDYQEIYQFSTSIFLEDTDSDGVSDFDEVSRGDDPLCPGREDCNLLKLITPETKFVDVVRDVQLDSSLTLQQAALQEFRAFLVQNGLSQEEVDQLTDEDLIVIFTAVDQAQGVDSDAFLEEASAGEIRAFLLAQPGADEDEINALSDEELLEIRDTLINI